MKARIAAAIIVGWLGLAITAAGTATAQDAYPSRDIRVVIAYAAGTGPDIVGRYYAEDLRKASGRNVIVENKPGALGAIAAQAVARSKPDGYTIFITSGNSTMSANPWLIKDLPYDPLKDFTPVTSLFKATFAFAVPLDSPFKTIDDLTRALRAKGDKAKYAYANSISLTATELYKQRANLDFVGVSYKTVPDSIAAMNAGEVDFSIIDLTFQKRAKLLGLTTPVRAPPSPDIPTSQEAGLPNFDLGVWWGVWLPAGAPSEVVEKLARWFDASAASNETRDFLAPLGDWPWAGVRGEDLKKLNADEIKRWGEAIKAAKIEPQ